MHCISPWDYSLRSMVLICLPQCSRNHPRLLGFGCFLPPHTNLAYSASVAASVLRTPRSAFTLRSAPSSHPSSIKLHSPPGKYVLLVRQPFASKKCQQAYTSSASPSGLQAPLQRSRSELPSLRFHSFFSLSASSYVGRGFFVPPKPQLGAPFGRIPFCRGSIAACCQARLLSLQALRSVPRPLPASFGRAQSPPKLRLCSADTFRALPMLPSVAQARHEAKTQQRSATLPPIVGCSLPFPPLGSSQGLAIGSCALFSFLPSLKKRSISFRADSQKPSTSFRADFWLPSNQFRVDFDSNSTRNVIIFIFFCFFLNTLFQLFSSSFNLVENMRFTPILCYFSVHYFCTCILRDIRH